MSQAVTVRAGRLADRREEAAFELPVLLGEAVRDPLAHAGGARRAVARRCVPDPLSSSASTGRASPESRTPETWRRCAPAASI